MQPLPFASGPFLYIEIGNYLLTAVCLLYTWRHARYQSAMMLAAILFGYVVEYSQVSKSVPPYHYTEAIVTLPGPVPLGIVLSWGIIIFAVYRTVNGLGLDGLRKACAAGLLAVGIDWVSDPAFVSLDFWIWAQPGAWYGIPWSNFVGWAVIVASFVAVLDLLYRRFPPGQRPFWQNQLVALAAVPVAFAMFVGIMLVYLWLVGLDLAWLPESRIVALYLVLPGVYVLSGIAAMHRNHVVDPLVLAVPGYLYGVSLLVLYLSDLCVRQPELTILFPIVVVLVMTGYCWPYLERLLAPAGAVEGGVR